MLIQQQQAKIAILLLSLACIPFTALGSGSSSRMRAFETTRSHTVTSESTNSSHCMHYFPEIVANSQASTSPNNSSTTTQEFMDTGSTGSDYGKKSTSNDDTSKQNIGRLIKRDTNGSVTEATSQSSNNCCSTAPESQSKLSMSLARFGTHLERHKTLNPQLFYSLAKNPQRFLNSSLQEDCLNHPTNNSSSSQPSATEIGRNQPVPNPLTEMHSRREISTTTEQIQQPIKLKKQSLFARLFSCCTDESN